MAWRVAKSLLQLESEIRKFSPNTEFGTIGNDLHQLEASDHNPNAAGVVCALDIMGGNGLNLASLAEQIRASAHPDLKYVIHNRRIASRKTGFVWRTYNGKNPHTDHIHVSVGVGDDGQSVPPYDDTIPWGVSASGGRMALGSRTIREGDQGDDVWELQHDLSLLGYTVPATAAWGNWERGGATTAAVRGFQGAKGLTVDGVCGPKTAAAVVAAVAALPPPPPPAPVDPAPTPTVDLSEVLYKLDALAAKVDQLAALHVGPINLTIERH